MSPLTNGSSSHRAASELLPWYLNGTLEGEELDLVTSHLRTCETCRLELERERRLARVLRTSDELAFPVERGLARLHARLDEEPESSRPAAPPTPEAPIRGLRGLLETLAPPVRWALGAQLALILVLGIALLSPSSGPGEFRTLSSPSEVGISEAPRLRIVFQPTASEGDLRALLLDSGARVVSGPSAYGVYTLEVATGDLDAALQQLRESALVSFVEPAPVHDAGAEP